MSTSTIPTVPQQRVFDYIESFITREKHAPSLRQIMDGLDYKSVAPVQHHITELSNLGYLTYTPSAARTLQILKPSNSVPLLGRIAAGGLVEPFQDESVSYYNLGGLNLNRQHFALQVHGDSMVGAGILHQDIVFLERPQVPLHKIRNGTIIAACIEGQTTLKQLNHRTNPLTLDAMNPEYESILVYPEMDFEVQGLYVGLMRGLPLP